jgi:ABC-type phosphate transport system auxiliary subunit
MEDAKDFKARRTDAPLNHQQEARRMAEDIAALEQQLDDKFQEILEAVASQLKLGKYDDLSDEDQERVENEAEAAADKWMEEAEDEGSTQEPKTPFEKLLAEYTAIAMKFPEEDDDEEDDEDEDDHKDDHKPRK